MRFLVIGCGSIGQRHARLLAERHDVDVVVCDTLAANRQAASEAAGRCPMLDGLDAALAESFDAAVVCTPNDSHAPISIACMQAGMDVLCEKPITDTLAQAEPMAAAAEELGRVVMIGYMARYHPGLQEMKRRVDEGVAGSVLAGRSTVGSYFTLMCARTPYRLQQKGVLVVDYTHEIDFMRWILGDVTRVYAVTRTAGDLPMVPDPNIIVSTLEFASGAVVSLHMDYVQHPQRRIFDLYGDKATLVLDFQTSTLQEFTHERDGLHEDHFPCHRDEFYKQEHAKFIEAMSARGVSPISIEDGMEAVRVAQAILESAEKGAPVTL